MNRFARTLLPALVWVLTPCLLPAQPSGVGLGISMGLAFPQGSSEEITLTDWSGSFNWGFYVDIPLLNTIHLTPSSELYSLGRNKATDIDLAFKFILPLDQMHIFAGFAPGLTAAGEVSALHVGALGGASFRLVSNLEVFALVKYNVLFQGESNIRVLHTNAGILFTL